MITEEQVMGGFNLSNDQWDGLPDLVRQALVESFEPPRPEPETEKPLVFGEDIYHHGEGCNGEFILRVKCSMGGKDFGLDGYSYDQLDVDEDESRLYCEGCGFELDFADWQDAANRKIEQDGEGKT